MMIDLHAAILSRHYFSPGRLSDLRQYKLHWCNPPGRLSGDKDAWLMICACAGCVPDLVVCILPMGLLRALAYYAADKSPETLVVQYVSREFGWWKLVLPDYREDQWPVWVPEGVTP